MNRDVKDHLRKGEASLHLRSNDPTPLFTPVLHHHLQCVHGGRLEVGIDRISCFWSFSLGPFAQGG